MATTRGTTSTTTARIPAPRVYGEPVPWADLYRKVTDSAPNLRAQLEALVQAAHHGADPRDVEAVRVAVWAAHERPGP